MEEPVEFRIEREIQSALERQAEICPYEVIFVDQTSETPSLLKISFWFPSDLEGLKKLIGYSSLCDKSGYMEFTETYTVVLRGFVLLSLLRVLKLSTD